MNWDMPTVIACVAAGGAIGAVLRYLVGNYIGAETFPWGTFIVNFIGCVILTFMVFSFSGQMSKNTMFFLFTGVLGAFTTMSTFTLETVNLFYDNEMMKAAFNVVLNGGVCLLGAFAGRFLSLLV
ncbi:MAG TPA: fluoride efflux transporter CrcB [Candidatus Methanomethylophilaceae archaeon]|nr:fluoride efflux transporter CrcB [Candidatus Methanomethylophilaceae archaeon]